MTEGEVTEERAWPGTIAAITLFVEDLEDAKRFYRDVFELPVAFADGHSAVFNFGDTMVNLLRTSEAPGLVEPAVVAAREAGSASSSPSAWTMSTRRATDCESEESRS